MTKTIHVNFVIFALLCSLPCVVTAQIREMKLGKIEKKVVAMSRYEKDTNAHAVILADVGQSYFSYIPSKGFVVNFFRHVRIKILDKEGYDWADQEIMLYNDGTEEESVAKLKGYTYNLDNGKLVKSKLKNDQIFDEKVSEHWDKVKFLMPDVKAGSVLEFTYTIQSDFAATLRTWEFQKSIPVVWSEYEIKIPEYFRYLTIGSGYESFTVNKQGTESERLTINTKNRSGYSSAIKTEFGTSTINYLVNTYHWAAKDMPALKGEKYMTTPKDYRLKMEFQLASTQFPGEPIENILGTWEEIDKKLTAHQNFGRQINRSNFFKEELAALTSGITDPVKKMAAIYRYVADNIQWDDQYSYIAGESIKKVFDHKKGSSAEINLLLTAMLREAGLKADPVILSTRDNGKIHYVYPILSKFNHVIAHVDIGDETFLLDGTEPLAPYTMLPPKCLNKRGRLISNEGSRWIDITPPDKYLQFTSVNCTLTENGALTGTVKISNGGYSAFYLREMLQDEGEEEFVKSMKSNLSLWDIDNFQLENAANIHTSFNQSFDISGSSQGTGTDIIYLNPVMFNREDENPFLIEERKFPVDLGFPVEETYMSRFAVPEGYRVEEMPKSISISLPGNAARFQYFVQTKDNIIQVMSKIKINKDFYLPQEYPGLKKFYSTIVAKHAEQMVLKKVDLNASMEQTK